MTDFSRFEKALKSLESALFPPPANDRERDGAIQRFEYTFEMAWKIAKRVLASHGIVSGSPKSVIRDLAQQGWILDPSAWLGFLDSRNLTTHIYKEEIANQVFAETEKFLPECKKLLERLRVEEKK